MSEAWPFDRLVPWPPPRAAERRLSLEAPESVRERVRRDLDLEGLESLVAEAEVRPWLDGMEIDGRVCARLTRLCGVTLEPFPVDVDEPLTFRMVPEGSPHAPRAEGEVVVDLDAEDPPDAVAGEGVSLGAYVVETLALALDPFPRKPGAVFEAPAAPEPESPFAALARLASRSQSE